MCDFFIMRMFSIGRGASLMFALLAFSVVALGQPLPPGKSASANLSNKNKKVAPTSSSSASSSSASDANAVGRPKLVIGLVVDQMRWDFLYRYYQRYDAKNGAFKRMLQEGFSCENTFIPYAPTVTACGHASVYTGSVPAINGIAGNAWWDRLQNRAVYCVEDKSVQTVGAPGSAGEMSPKNLHVTTIGDELKLATNFNSKVFGIALKDRGAILPAGHAANGAFWFDSKSGKFITSTFYGKDLPIWVQEFNDKKWPDRLLDLNWNTLYPIETYQNSTADQKPYEAKPFGNDAPGFPYDLARFKGKNYGALSTSPHGNTLTLEMAKAAVLAENLGKNEKGVTDFLAVSLSSPDYIGHSFGPNSIETEDAYLRLDQELGAFLKFLDQQVGKGHYLLFLTADHGVAHVPGFFEENKLPAGNFNRSAWLKKINQELLEEFKSDKLIVSTYNYQIHYDQKLMDSLEVDLEDINEMVVASLLKEPGVAYAVPMDELMESPLQSTIKERVVNGYNYHRGGDVLYVLQPQFLEGGKTGTSHGLWNPYDAHIPLLFMGWNIKPGKTNRETYMTDIAPTLGALLRIQMPNGSVGKVVTEITEAATAK